ncbi:hypothetical protein RyT2_01990 [Pseudolactococcus yaeyamensis]|nr:hypothetical protein FACS1894192_00640 [Bacilli bacterium]
MKHELFKMKDNYLKDVIYDGLSTDRVPKTVFGNQGSYQRHLLADAKNGSYMVITKNLKQPIPVGSVVKIINPIFNPEFIHGMSIAPALNVYAENIEIVGGTN